LVCLILLCAVNHTASVKEDKQFFGEVAKRAVANSGKKIHDLHMGKVISRNGEGVLSNRFILRRASQMPVFHIDVNIQEKRKPYLMTAQRKSITATSLHNIYYQMVRQGWAKTPTPASCSLGGASRIGYFV